MTAKVAVPGFAGGISSPGQISTYKPNMLSIEAVDSRGEIEIPLR